MRIVPLRFFMRSGFFFLPSGTQNGRDKTQTVHCPPRYESPVCSVPQSTDNKGNKNISKIEPFALHAAPAQRNEYIVPEPGRERDVPPPPKLRNAAGKIRVAEILTQAD